VISPSLEKQLKKLSKKDRKGRTYEEWKARGYHVRKGETSTRRNQFGEVVFLFSQVKKYKWDWDLLVDYIDDNWGDR